jgi:FkbM family methyltransferase
MISMSTKEYEHMDPIEAGKWAGKYDKVGSCLIRLPDRSQVLHYKEQFHLYDTALADIAEVVWTRYPNVHAIDIGANVGDSAALIRKAAKIPVLCVEGDSLLLPILEENVSGMGPGVAIEPSFVGVDGDRVDIGSIDDPGHNASIVNAFSDRGQITLRSLERILEDYPAFSRAKLMKVDVEGMDFDLIRLSAGFIRNVRPVIFFEYNPSFRPDKPDAGLETIDVLIGAGYSVFLYYDNFGNFLLSADAVNRRLFIDLDRYLASNRRHGVAIYYFDICAFHAEDSDLAPVVRSRSL